MNFEDLQGWILAITALGSLAGAIAALRGARTERRRAQAERVRIDSEKETAEADQEKARAEAAAATVATAMTLLKPLQEQVAALEVDVTWLRNAVVSRDHLAARHTMWDDFAERALSEAGIDYPPRPSLRPESMSLHDASCLVHDMERTPPPLHHTVLTWPRGDSTR